MNEVRAKYEALSAQVAQAELNLENTKIRAPSDGFIAKKAVEVGQLANPGVPLYGFVDASERWVTANFKETDLEAIKVGNAVDISVDAISSKTFKGKVLSLSAATGATFTLLPPDNATGNFTKVIQRIPVKILFEGLTPDEIDSLRAGLSADVKVHKH
ncbi:putative multidrug resistance protein EmrK [compost metagenome]